MKFYWKDIRDKKYQVMADYVHSTDIRHCEARTEYIDLDLDGTLTIRKGWLYDGPSGLTYDSPEGMRAAAVHDAFYYLMRLGIVPLEHRRRVDTIFWEILIEDGMDKGRAELWFQAVAKFAEFAATGPEPKEEIFSIGKE